ncbi:HER209Cp [Eremothecium sinecaudum]|uniref:HER209Cp n=1 Tax=Eremothecium sinecaudum TaxID=45286 RepID=A0A0X8HTZ6_9SACH|nr:HER209Cp [Eremothecium sinecaudum]AMD21487.1 HER209Cp [Eremothecium sinecaudum]
MAGEDSLLPQRDDIGIQLGIGISSSNLYVPADSRLSDEHKTQWIEGYMETGISNLRALRVVEGSQLLVTDANGPVGNAAAAAEHYLLSDELLDEDDDDPVNERELLLGATFNSSNAWNDILPELPQPFDVFRNVTIPQSSMYKVNFNKPVTNRAYVPKALISSLSKNDLPLGSQEEAEAEAEAANNERKHRDLGFKIVDPTRTQIFNIGSIQTAYDLRQDREGKQVIAFASGEANSVLNISLLCPQAQRVEVNEDKATIDNIITLQLHQNCQQLELFSSIKSIKIPKPSTALNRSSNSIFVLTEVCLLVIRILSIDYASGRINLQRLEPLEYTQFEQFPIVDVAMNPWNLDEFAIIDSKGNWCIGEIAKSKKKAIRLRLMRKYSGTIFDPEEVSNWKRIEWASNHTTLFLISRSSFIEMNYMEDWQLEVIQAKTWSRLQDYKRIGEDLGVLLTTKEVIFIKHDSYGVKRLLSWKHEWNSKDASLKFAVYENYHGREQVIYVALYSRMSPMVVSNHFWMKNNVFQASRTPHLLELPNISTGINCIVFPEYFETHESDDVFIPIYVRALKGSRIWRYLLSNKACKIYPVKEYDTLPHLEAVHGYITESCSKDEEELLSQVVAKFSDSLPNKQENYDSSIEYLKFQEYGYQLSEMMNKTIEGWKREEEEEEQTFKPASHVGNLSEITKGPGYFENVEEFSSLLQQFIEYYENHGITFNRLKTISKLLIKEPVDSFDILHSKLLQCWEPISDNAIPIAIEIIKYVALDSMAFYNLTKLKEIDPNVYGELSSTCQEVFDLWDEDEMSYPDTQTTQNQEDTALSSIRPSSSQIPPTIRSSQPSGQTLRSSLPDSMSPAFSLLSQQSQPIASNNSQSKTYKRKKRRVRGFG